MHVIAVEYPGYGYHTKANHTCNAESILNDADHVFNFLINNLNLSPANIILMGRSLGTGPASYLASQHKVGALILISGFTSIRGVVSDLAGVLKFLVKERFNNLEHIAKVVSPTFFLHGKKDTLISHNQSIILQSNKIFFFHYHILTFSLLVFRTLQGSE